jgi:hypothetical protein
MYFLAQKSGADLIKLFWCKFTQSFCKLGRFITVNKIVSV